MGKGEGGGGEEKGGEGREVMVLMVGGLPAMSPLHGKIHSFSNKMFLFGTADK